MEGVTEMSHQGLLVYPQVEEKDWNVLGLVLEKASRSFQNKGMLTRYGKDISQVSILCSHSHPLPNIHTLTKCGQPEFQSNVYPVLAALASYNRSLEHDL